MYGGLCLMFLVNYLFVKTDTDIEQPCLTKLIRPARPEVFIEAALPMVRPVSFVCPSSFVWVPNSDTLYCNVLSVRTYDYESVAILTMIQV